MRFDIRANQSVHPISSLIYGTNQTDGGATDGYTLLRMGGNRLTAYNWENNASNAGSDYLFQNDGYLSSSNTPGAAVKANIDVARSLGAAALLTVPIVDYVAADKNGGGDVRNSGSAYLATRFRQNKPTKGAPLSAVPDGTDGFVYQDEFVNWVKTTQTGVRIVFALDNEPDLWNSTHAEVHPAAVLYTELARRNLDFGNAVKNTWPQAEVAGFVSYGFNGYVTLQNAPDSAAHGNFIDYYLDQMKAAETAAGHRVIDYLDLHWYSEATGGGQRITDPGNATAKVAARVQAPRSLWDPTYTETSWIPGYLGNQPIKLLARLQAQIAAHYPGTRLSFSEWSYGGGDHISGAIAVADALGIFGRDSVGFASYWKLGANEQFAEAAFRLYRNYDQNLSAFGDTSISAVSSDVPTATVYASLDSANVSRVVIVAINKSTATKTAAVTLAHPIAFSALKVFTLAGSSATVVAGADVPSVDTNAFRYTMPSMSISVLVPVP